MREALGSIPAPKKKRQKKKKKNANVLQLESFFLGTQTV
jgi:hypothetical protein